MLIHTTHHRMIVSQDSLVEDAVEITNNTFVRSTTDPEAAANLGTTSWLKTFTQAANPYKTPLIITGAIITAILVMAVPAKILMGRSGNPGAVNINNYNTAKPSSNNSNKLDVDMGNMEVDPLYPALHDPAAAEQEEEEVLQAEEEDEEVKIWKILKKAAHLRSAKERIAVDNWSKQQDPFQL